jgi:hypothetical protein
MKRYGSLLLSIVASAIVGPTVSRADPVVVENQETPLLSPEERQATAGNISLSVPPASAPNPSPFVWGDVVLMPHLSYSLTYSDGIPDQPGHFTNTYVETLAPGFLLDVGGHWSVDYTPSWNVYTNRRFYNYWGHDAKIAGTESLDGWEFRFTQDYLSTSNTLVETGVQTKQQAYDTLLSSTHFFVRGAYVELSASQNLRFVTLYPDSLEWSTTDWIGYKAGAQLDIAAGCGEGFVIMYGSPDMLYTRPKVRIKSDLTEKVTLSLEGGFEHREFLSGDLGSLNNPVMDGKLEYRPFDTTTLEVDTERAVSASYFRGQLTRSAKYNALLQQRFLGRFYLSATLGYNANSYVGTDAGVEPGRRDNDTSYGGRLSTAVFGRGSLAFFVQNLSNRSNVAGYTFSTRQMGCEFSYHY